jgi:hypothetical protein
MYSEHRQESTSKWKATREACTYIVRRLIRRLLGDAHATEITMRISGRLENRHVHCQESKWNATCGGT